MNAIHSARRAFICAESSEKIKRALTKKTRTATSLVFENGQSVYYKRKGEPAWKGPGTVIGKDGSVIFVKHGGIVVRVHPSSMRHENSEFVTDGSGEDNIDDRSFDSNNNASNNVCDVDDIQEEEFQISRQ